MIISRFKSAFDYMLSNEDYPIDDKRFGQSRIDNDGGKVRLGINSNSFPEMIQIGYYDMPIDQAIKTAMNLYNNNVWSYIHGDSIDSLRVGMKLFDMAVNMGNVEASKLGQRAAFGVNSNKPGFKVDGIIGPISLREINRVVEGNMLMKLVFLWQSFITQVLLVKPQYKSDEKDWRTRANKLPLDNTSDVV